MLCGCRDSGSFAYSLPDCFSLVGACFFSVWRGVGATQASSGCAWLLGGVVELGSAGGEPGLASLCLMWLFWLERNRRVFQGRAQSIIQLQSCFCGVSCSWVSGQVDPNLFVALDFVDDLVG